MSFQKQRLIHLIVFIQLVTLQLRLWHRLQVHQYGGQSFSLGHLAPFVQVSRDKITEEVMKERDEVGVNYSDEQLKMIVERRRVRDEIT